MLPPQGARRGKLRSVSQGKGVLGEQKVDQWHGVQRHAAPSPTRRWVTKEGDPVEDKLGEIGKINLRRWVQHHAASLEGR